MNTRWGERARLVGGAGLLMTQNKIVSHIIETGESQGSRCRIWRTWGWGPRDDVGNCLPKGHAHWTRVGGAGGRDGIYEDRFERAREGEGERTWRTREVGPPQRGGDGIKQHHVHGDSGRGGNDSMTAGRGRERGIEAVC